MQVHSERRPIQILSPAVADQIAAGEVVERPANALKELLENACDAGASRIQVLVRGGGLERIEVSDDGYGIPPEELPLAISRYATSKIRDASELHQLNSYGFRGEALAAIAAVSRIRLESRSQGAELGHGLVCEASQILESNGCVRGPGTKVVVENLFLNTPARRNFLKTNIGESNQCKLVFLRAALAQPGIHYTLQLDDRPALVLPSRQDLCSRAVDVFQVGFGIELRAEELVAFAEVRGPYRAHGLLLPARLNVKNARGIHTFVNGRAVRDRVMQQAVIAGVREVLFGHEYPQAILCLEVEASEVDVNVHPTKAEVRFRDPGPFGLIRRAIAKALLKLEPVPSKTAEETAPNVEAGSLTSRSKAAEESGLRAPSFGPLFAEEPKPSLPAVLPAHLDLASPAAEAAPAALEESPRSEGGLRPFLDFLGVAKSTYLVCQDAEGLFFVDQHAAHERIRFERLKKARVDEIGRAATLLLPLTVKCERFQLDLLLDIAPDLARFGLQIERFGEEYLRITAIPELLLDANGRPRLSIERLLKDLAADLAAEENKEDLLDLLRRSILHTLATESCHSSVRAGQRLGRAEAEALLQAMRETDYSGHCPHGRPTTVRISWSELERLFKRKL